MKIISLIIYRLDSNAKAMAIWRVYFRYRLKIYGNAWWNKNANRTKMKQFLIKLLSSFQWKRELELLCNRSKKAPWIQSHRWTTLSDLLYIYLHRSSSFLIFFAGTKNGYKKPCLCIRRIFWIGGNLLFLCIFLFVFFYFSIDGLADFKCRA